MTFGETFRAVLIEYRSPRRWIGVIAMSVPVVIFAVWLTYLVWSLGLLDRDDFSLSNSRGYLRSVLLLFLGIIIAIPPALIAVEVLGTWVAAERQRATLAIAVSAIVVGLAGVAWVAEFWAADRCLDRGGSFNYVAGECDNTSSQPFVPFKKRHPFLSSASVVAGLFGLAIAIEVNRRSRRPTPRSS